MTTTQVFASYEELAKLQDKHVVSPEELEKDRQIRTQEVTVSEIAEQAREAVRLALHEGHRIAFLDVKVCFSACAQDVELQPAGAPDTGPSLRAKNLMDGVLMCEVYNALSDKLPVCEHGVLLIMMGYEGYRSTDARHVQDSDDTLWLADTSPEQIPYVMWVCEEHKNEQLNYRIENIGSNLEGLLAYSFASHCNYVRVLLQLESNALVALQHLGPCYESMHMVAKLRWLVHRAKGELIRVMPLDASTKLMSSEQDEILTEEFNFKVARNWDTFVRILDCISKSSKQELVDFVKQIYKRTGEDTEQELLWQALTYRLFKLLQAEDSKVKHVNIYDRHQLLTGHNFLDGNNDWIEEEDEVDQLFMRALEAEDEEQLAPMPFLDYEVVVGEHYAISMKKCGRIRQDHRRLKARKTWDLPEAIAKEITVMERGTKKSKSLVFVDSTKVVECNYRVLHRLKRAISGLKGVTVAGFGVLYDVNQLEQICDTNVNNVVNRIVRGELGYEAFSFLANLILRGCLVVSKASTTACFVPERNKRDDGVCITSFVSRSVMSYVGGNLRLH